ncbi:hypothetical protein TIFTF001_052590 [Ficus carica]|uniref:Uncharacterized protein n=1 Tax=Ficus carica TaxID=3494 RepID=A0AA87ZNL0_FICCA|nr:hypothetical protein TIFTF001_001541 [Ficus carica]GMN70932.1 hypothetical protein TIFTF001_052590 [Ficus carica]
MFLTMRRRQVHTYQEKSVARPASCAAVMLDYKIRILGKLITSRKTRIFKDGTEQHLQVNHVAPMLLTLLLLPSLLKTCTWHIIVNVNSLVQSIVVRCRPSPLDSRSSLTFAYPPPTPLSPFH